MKNDLLAKLERLDEKVSLVEKRSPEVVRHTEKSWKQRFMSFWRIHDR